MASQFIKLPVEGGGGPSPGVDSFNGRTGVVVSQAGDYSAGIVSNTPAGDIAATNVQTAINELDTEKQAVITGAATTITTADLTASRAVVSDGSGKIAASAVTATEVGYLSGTTSAVQTQLDAKQPLDADLTAVAGLATTGLIARTGAGTAATRTITGNADVLVADGNGVSANPTLSLSTTGVTPGLYSNPNVTVDAQGRVIAIATGVTPAYNPDLSIQIKDDFTGSTPGLGGYGFTLSNTGTGANSTTGATTLQDITGKALGVMQMTTGTTTTGRTTVSTSLATFVTGFATIDAQSRLWLPTTGTVPDNYEFSFGLIDNTGAAGGGHTDGAYFRFVGNGVNVNWQTLTSAGGVSTTTNTSSPVLINNPQTFRIVINEAANLVQFYIDGVLVNSHVTNIPQAGQFFGFGWKMGKTLGTTAALAFVDWGYLDVSYSGPRG
jgi:hypothetical protein